MEIPDPKCLFMVTYQISEIYDDFAGKRDSSITLTCTPETHIFFPGNRAKLCLRSDNVHCHPSCPCEYSLFWKPLYRSLIIILIFVREIFCGKVFYKRLQNVFLLTKLENLALCHCSVSYAMGFSFSFSTELHAITLLIILLSFSPSLEHHFFFLFL